MKKYLILPAIALTFASCSEKKEAASETPAETSTEMAADAKPYPLKVCLVSGEELGSMGEPTSIVHEGQTIKFCCDNCKPKFDADPEKFLVKLKSE